MPSATSDPARCEALRAASVGILDAGGFIAGDQADERYCTDWSGARGRPLAVLRPRNTEEVSRTLAVLHGLNQPVVVQGGGTGLVGACVPQPGEAVLSLERLRTIEEIDPLSATATVQAGVCLQTLQQAVEAQGLYFPVDIGSRGSCQIGGIVATNAGGNRVLRYGMTRQSVLGLEVVLPDGRVVSRMGKVLKDNAGFDLKQMFIGSEGCLGVITRVLLALQPLPTGRHSALVAVQGFDAVLALLAECRRRLGPRLSSFEVMWRDFYDISTGLLKKGPPGLQLAGSHVVLVEAAGYEPAADEALFADALADFEQGQSGCEVVLAQSLAQTQQLWAIRDAAGEAARAMSPCVGFDVSLPLASMAGWVDETHQRLRAMGLMRTQTYGHLGDGNLHLLVGLTQEAGVSDRVNELVYASVGALGGSISGEHGIGLSKKAYLRHNRSGSEIELMKQLKIALDPRSLLNRGRIFDLP